jgi:hypothetical protein
MLGPFVGRATAGPKWNELVARQRAIGLGGTPGGGGFVIPGALVATSVVLSLGALAWARWFS